MWTTLSQSDPRSRLNLLLLALFVVAAFLFGGASRADVPAQTIVRLVALGLIVSALLQIRLYELRSVRAPLVFALGVLLIVSVQLVPLPPSVWESLPGREIYVQALDAGGLAPVWRPLSLTPDLTLNSLLAFLPVIAVILGIAVIDRSLQTTLVPLILVGIAFSGIIGVLQIASGNLYFYRITNLGSAVGVFANRNHAALLLTIAFPLLVTWAYMPHPDIQYRRVRTWLALCVAAVIFPLLLITGSRAGLALGVVSLLASVLLLLTVGNRSKLGQNPRSRLANLALWGMPLGLGLAAVGATLFLARDEAMRRFSDAAVETRVEQLPVFGKMIRAFTPWGSGYGSFDPVYRAFEPHEALNPNYLNHAHNDLAQILIEGGILAGVALIVFLAYYSARLWRLWHRPSRHYREVTGRGASIVILLILLGSLVDYPLRTPLISVIFAISCFLMIPAATEERASGKEILGTSEALG